MAIERVGLLNGHRRTGTPGAWREWINAGCEVAIKHLKHVCGEPPEMELYRIEVQWQEHDPLIVLIWEDAMRGGPWEYIEKCESALTEYSNKCCRAGHTRWQSFSWRMGG
jgi:hypothetical protein